MNIGPLRILIQESDLKYLSPKQRRKLLTGFSSEVEITQTNVNTCIESILEGGNLKDFAQKKHFKYNNVLFFSQICKNFEELKIFCEKKGVREIIQYRKIENLRILLKLFRIETLEQFETLCEKEGMKEFFMNRNMKNLKILLTLEGITPEQFKVLCENERVRVVLRYGEIENLRVLLKLYKVETPEQFEVLCENELVRKIIQYGNTENLKVLLKLYKVETPDQFEVLCENERVREVLRYGEIENLRVLLKLYKVETPEQFEVLCENEGVGKIIQCGNTENLKVLLKLYKVETPDQFEVFCEKEGVREVLRYGKIENLRILLKLYKVETPDQFEVLYQNWGIRNILMNGKTENLQVLLNLEGITLERFEIFCEKDYMMRLLEYGNTENLRVLLNLEGMTLERFEILIENKWVRKVLKYGKIQGDDTSIQENLQVQSLNSMTHFNITEINIFNVLSLGSDFLTTLWDYMRQHPDTSIENCFKELLKPICAEIINGINTEETLKENNTTTFPKLDIALYVRYGHQVDYPEIAEALIFAVQEYIRNGKSQVFRGIRILPREPEVFNRPSQFLLKKNNTTFHNARGNRFKELLCKGAVSIYLSHSSNEPNDIGAMLSGGMKGKKISEGDRVSQIELEQEQLVKESCFCPGDTPIERYIQEIIDQLIAMEKHIISQRKHNK